MHAHTYTDIDDSLFLVLPAALVSDLGLEIIIKQKTNVCFVSPVCTSLLVDSALVHLEAFHVSFLLIRHFFQSLYLRLQCVISLLKMSDKAKERQS